MDHACQQCGTAVEDGRPFCPQCRAPQIHVQIALADAGDATGLNPAIDEVSPETSESRNANFSGDRPRNDLDSRIAVRAALKAGLLGILIGAIPLIGIPLTGALAVFFYRRKSRSIVPAALGARLGGAAGLVVFAIGALLAVAIVGLHAQQQCIDMMMNTFQKLGANTADPQLRASIHEVFTPSGQAIAFFVTVVPASIGGVLASFFLRSRSPGNNFNHKR